MGKWTSTTKTTALINEWSLEAMTSWKISNRMPASQEKMYDHCYNHHMTYDNRGNRGKVKERYSECNKKKLLLKLKLSQIAVDDLKRF